MLPLRLKIHGYRSYVDAEINFAEYGPIVAITGENGAGKSSIIEMLTTVLYYRNSCTDERGAGMDEVINTGCDEFRLEFDFTMNDVLYTIISSKKRGGNRELLFIVDGTDVSGKLADTQAKINEVLKLSYDTFMDTVCIGQGTSSKFMDKTPNERRAVFTQLLDLRRYEAYEKAARDQRKAAKEKQTALEATVSTLTAQQVDTVEVQAEIDRLTAEKAELDVKLDEAKEKLKQEQTAKAKHQELVRYASTVLTARKQLTDQEQRLAAALERLKSSRQQTAANAPAQVDQAEVDAAKTAAEDAATAEQSARENLAAGKARRESLALQAADAKAVAVKAEQLGEGVCQTCGAAITPQSKANHVATLKQTAVELEQRVAKIDAKLQEVSAHVTELSQAKQQTASAYQTLVRQQAAADKAAAELKQMDDRLEADEARLHETRAQLEENLKTQVRDVPQQTFNDVALEAAVHAVEREVSQCTAALAVANERLTKAQQLAKDLDKAKKDETKAKQLYTDLGAVATAFSKTGIQARILASDLPAIEKECNEVITALCDGELSIAFVTSEQVGKGKDKHTVETMDIEVRDAFGARRYASYSGGERFRVDFACHVGLARYLTRRAGATMDFFIIDEGLGSQDDAARQRFTEMLHRMSKFFKQIMVITHIAEVQDAFDSRVIVQKDPVKGSQVKVIAA